MTREMASAAVPVGCISYMNISSLGLKPDVLFIFDINLPEDFVPKPLDGEVSCVHTHLPFIVEGGLHTPYIFRLKALH